LERLLIQAGLKGQVELVGSFCMGECSPGISVRVGDRQYRELQLADVDRFFRQAVLSQIQSPEGSA
jgi:NADH:ubiquinone oxidoreductase subunit E